MVEIQHGEDTSWQTPNEHAFVLTFLEFDTGSAVLIIASRSFPRFDTA